MSALPVLDAAAFRRLPEPVRLEDTVTSQDSVAVAPEMDDRYRETRWMLLYCP